MSTPSQIFNLKVPVPTASGHVIEYNTVLEGPPNKPLVVLAHALMADLRMWDSTVKALTQSGYRTLRYDYVGHGGTHDRVPLSRRRRGSEVTDIPFRFDEFTKHLREIVLRATGQEHIHAIIGCSMGGVLALRFAMLYPSAVSRVVSCDAPGLTSLEKAKPLWKERVEEFQQHGVEDLAHKTVERWFPEPCTQAIKDAALVQTRSCTFEGYSICAEAIQNYDYEGQLAKVKVKTLILAGDKDSSIGPPEVLQKVADGIKHAQYVQIKDSGHLPPMHQPEEFESVVIKFLEKKEKGQDA